MTNSTLREYIDANASLPPEVVLGNLAWFEISDGEYSAADLEAGFVKHNLNPAFLPPAINPADAYEKASKGVEGLKYPISLGTGNGTAVVLVRDVSRAGDQIVRHLVREVRDETNKHLSYETVGELIFYRPVERGGKVDHNSARVRATLMHHLTPEEAATLSPLVNQFYADFDRHRNFHDGQKMRGVIRSYLRYLNGTLMKSSVYFVHVNRADELLRLQSFARGFDGISLALWQIPDLKFHREEVIEAFQQEAVKELTAVVADIQKAREKTKSGATFAQYAKLKDRVDDTLRRASEYGRTLEISQDMTATASEMALDALVALRTEIYNAANAT